MKRLMRLVPTSLVGQLVLTGGLVMFVAALIVGSWVSKRIEQGVVQSSAGSAALFLEGFISRLSQEFLGEEGLSEPARAALREIFFGTALSDRVVSYKIWNEDGLIPRKTKSVDRNRL